MHFSELAVITGGTVVNFASDRPLTYFLTDSRKPVIHEGALFFAITGDRHDGHEYIRSLYEQGVRQFIVEKKLSLEEFSAGECTSGNFFDKGFTANCRVPS